MEKRKVHEFMREVFDRPENDAGSVLFDLRESGSKQALFEEGLTVSPNQHVVLLLGENPSTGYSWQLDKVAGHGFWTAQEEYKKVPLTSDRLIVGNPGIKNITLTVGAETG